MFQQVGPLHFTICSTTFWWKRKKNEKKNEKKKPHQPIYLLMSDGFSVAPFSQSTCMINPPNYARCFMSSFGSLWRSSFEDKANASTRGRILTLWSPRLAGSWGFWMGSVLWFNPSKDEPFQYPGWWLLQLMPVVLTERVKWIFGGNLWGSAVALKKVILYPVYKSAYVVIIASTLFFGKLCMCSDIVWVIDVWRCYDDDGDDDDDDDADL